MILEFAALSRLSGESVFEVTLARASTQTAVSAHALKENAGGFFFKQKPVSWTFLVELFMNPVSLKSQICELDFTFFFNFKSIFLQSNSDFIQ